MIDSPFQKSPVYRFNHFLRAFGKIYKDERFSLGKYFGKIKILTDRN